MRKILIVFTLISFFFNINICVYAVELGGTAIEKDDSIVCEYSEEYIKYLALSDEEKKDIEVPSMCKFTASEVTMNNITSYSLTKENNTKLTNYPSYFSLTNKDKNALPPVKDQMDTGTCWTFSANTTLESYFLNKTQKLYDFSERHMEYSTSLTFSDGINKRGYNRELDVGGNFYIASGYYLSKFGPVDEKEMPFENSSEKISLNEIENKTPIANVKSTLNIAGNKCSQVSNTIKDYLMNNGAMTTSIRYDTQYIKTYIKDGKTVYNLNYTGNDGINHGVNIVGWDDNYSKENFVDVPKSDGAWIVRNSWGENWGLSGYFYVSYEDMYVCSYLGGIVDADTKFSDNYYSHTIFGINSEVGGNGYTAYGAVVYEKGIHDELLTEVTVGSLSYKEIEVYLIDKDDSLSIDNAKLIATDTILYGGYKTIKLEEPILLTDNKFSIIVKYTGLTYYPIGVASYNNNLWKTVKTNYGESYFSNSGKSFTDFKKLLSNPTVVAISAGTMNTVSIKETSRSSSEITDRDGGSLEVNYETNEIPEDSLLSYKILSSNNENVTNKFNVSVSPIKSNISNIKVIIPPDKKISFGDYKLILSYKGIDYITKFTVYKYQNIVIDNINDNEIIYNAPTSEFFIDIVKYGYDNGLILKIMHDNADYTSKFTVTPTENDGKERYLFKLIDSVPKGEYTLEFTAENKSYKFSINIEEFIAIQNINVSYPNMVLSDGSTEKIKYEIEPQNATSNQIVFSSNNENVVKIDEEGNISTYNRGHAIISIYSKSDPKVNKTIELEVINSEIKIGDLEIIPNQETSSKIYDKYGGKVTSNLVSENITNLEINVLDSSGEPVTNKFNLSYDEKHFDLEVPSNTISGTYCINVRGEYKIENKLIDFATDMKCFDVDEYILVTAINARDIEIYENDTCTIIPEILPKNALNQSLIYLSDNSDIISTDKYGNVTGKSAGTAHVTIYNELSMVSTKVKVTVKDNITKNNDYVLDSKNNIIGINTNKDVSKLISEINLSEVTEIFDNHGNLKDNGKVGTGYTIIKSSNDKRYNIIIKGEITSDGQITISDVSKLYNFYTKRINITEDAYLIAADVNDDDKITISDVSKLYSFYTKRINKL